MSDIIKAQQGLARKAQANKEHRFEDLYHLLCKREWIEEALRHVLNNDGSQTPGIDGMSWKTFNDAEKSDFENEKFRQQFIDELQAELKARTYQPLPVRRVEIPKPGTSKKRPLGIPTVKDRTVQMLLKMVLEPIWEADFYYFSNGFRPGRCTMDCIQPLYKLCGTRTGYRWVIEGDIRACFDKIPHEHLLNAVARRIADTGILALIRRFLKSGIMIERTLVPSEEGTPQGGIASPLLANIYLHRFDEWYSHHYGVPDKQTDKRTYLAWQRRRFKGKDQAAVQMFRYADDWILVIRGTYASHRERLEAGASEDQGDDHKEYHQRRLRNQDTGHQCGHSRMGHVLPGGQPDGNLSQTRLLRLAPAEEMAGKEVSHRAKRGQTTVHATSTWAERRQR